MNTIRIKNLFPVLALACLTAVTLAAQRDASILVPLVPAARMTDAAYSPDGNYFVVTGDDVILFDAIAHTPLRLLNNHGIRASAAAFSPNSAFLAVEYPVPEYTGGARRIPYETCVYTVPEGRPVWRFLTIASKPDYQRKIEIFEDNAHLATSNRDGIYVFHMATGKLIWSYEPDPAANPHRSAGAFDYAPASGAFLYKLQRIQFPVRSGVMKGTFENVPYPQIFDNLLSPDAKWAIVSGNPQSPAIKQMEVNTGEIRAVFDDIHAYRLASGKLFKYIAHPSGILKIDEGWTAKVVPYVDFARMPNLPVAVSPDEREVTIGNYYFDPRPLKWAEPGREIPPQQLEQFISGKWTQAVRKVPISHFGFGMDADTFVFANEYWQRSYDGANRKWTARNMLAGNTSKPLEAPTPNLRLPVTEDMKRQLGLNAPNPGEPATTLTMQKATDGRHVAVFTASTELPGYCRPALYDIQQKRELTDLPWQADGPSIFTPDAKFWIYASGRHVSIRLTRDGVLSREYNLSSGVVTDLEPSPDSRRIMAINRYTGRVDVLELYKNEVTDVFVCKDIDNILVLSPEGSVSGVIGDARSVTFLAGPQWFSSQTIPRRIELANLRSAKAGTTGEKEVRQTLGAGDIIEWDTVLSGTKLPYKIKVQPGWRIVELGKRLVITLEDRILVSFQTPDMTGKASDLAKEEFVRLKKAYPGLIMADKTTTTLDNQQWGSYALTAETDDAAFNIILMTHCSQRGCYMITVIAEAEDFQLYWEQVSRLLGSFEFPPDNIRRN